MKRSYLITLWLRALLFFFLFGTGSLTRRECQFIIIIFFLGNLYFVSPSVNWIGSDDAGDDTDTCNDTSAGVPQARNTKKRWRNQVTESRRWNEKKTKKNAGKHAAAIAAAAKETKVVEGVGSSLPATSEIKFKKTQKKKKPKIK